MYVGTAVIPSPRASASAASRLPAYVPLGEFPAEKNGIEPHLPGQSGQHLHVADILGVREVRRENRAVELRVLSGVPRELGGFDGEARVGEQSRRVERQPQLHAALPLALLAAKDARTEQALERDTLRRGLGVDLVADPGVFEGKLFFQLIDNTRADIAVGSYVVGEDPDLDCRVAHPSHLPHFGSAAPAQP